MHFSTTILARNPCEQKATTEIRKTLRGGGPERSRGLNTLYTLTKNRNATERARAVSGVGFGDRFLESFENFQHCLVTRIDVLTQHALGARVLVW